MIGEAAAAVFVFLRKRKGGGHELPTRGDGRPRRAPSRSSSEMGLGVDLVGEDATKAAAGRSARPSGARPCRACAT